MGGKGRAFIAIGGSAAGYCAIHPWRRHSLPRGTCHSPTVGAIHHSGPRVEGRVTATGYVPFTSVPFTTQVHVSRRTRKTLIHHSAAPYLGQSPCWSQRRGVRAPVASPERRPGANSETPHPLLSSCLSAGQMGVPATHFLDDVEEAIARQCGISHPRHGTTGKLARNAGQRRVSIARYMGMHCHVPDHSLPHDRTRREVLGGCRPSRSRSGKYAALRCGTYLSGKPRHQRWGGRAASNFSLVPGGSTIQTVGLSPGSSARLGSCP